MFLNITIIKDFDATQMLKASTAMVIISAPVQASACQSL